MNFIRLWFRITRSFNFGTVYNNRVHNDAIIYHIKIRYNINETDDYYIQNTENVEPLNSHCITKYSDNMYVNLLKLIKNLELVLFDKLYYINTSSPKKLLFLSGKKFNHVDINNINFNDFSYIIDFDAILTILHFIFLNNSITIPFNIENDPVFLFQYLTRNNIFINEI